MSAFSSSPYESGLFYCKEKAPGESHGARGTDYLPDLGLVSVLLDGGGDGGEIADISYMLSCRFLTETGWASALAKILTDMLILLLGGMDMAPVISLSPPALRDPLEEPPDGGVDTATM